MKLIFKAYDKINKCDVDINTLIIENAKITGITITKDNNIYDFNQIDLIIEPRAALVCMEHGCILRTESISNMKGK